jgi:exoribonuclease-2
VVGTHTIVEFREGGRVCSALVLSGEGGSLDLLTSAGRQVRLPAARIVHATGERLAPQSPAAALDALKRFEDAAARRASDVDLALVHGLYAEQADRGETAPDLSLADLAVLALGEDSPGSRAAVHRALVAPNPYFRFDGERWRHLPPEEVEAERRRLHRQHALAAERATFLAAARERLAGHDVSLPDTAAKFLRPLRELAVEGEACKTRKEATALAHDLAPDEAARGLGPEEAFDLMVRLGVFARDENVPVLRAGVHVAFSADVLAEAEELARRPLDAATRLDLRGLEVVTIDDAHTTEIDDGVSLEAIPAGFRLGVHVADAAHFIPLGCRVDEEALARSTSHYLPDWTIPMIPPVLGEVACSLVAGEDRPAISVLADVTPHGEILRAEVRRTVVRIACRITYDDCEEALEGRADGPTWLRPLADLAADLERERLERGATPIRAPELAITFDGAGEPVIQLVDPGRLARRLVSEMMILANRIIAETCVARGLPAIYRKQAPPETDVPRPPMDRYDPVAVNRFRRVLQRTEVSLEPGPHAGLGLPCYLQATSPIRRYQDLAVHRLLTASILGLPQPYGRDEMAVVAATTEQAGRQARQVETETDQYWVLRHLEKRVGAILAGVIVRADDRKTWVELHEYAQQFPIARRPDHAAGAAIRLRVVAARPRRGSLTLEELRP